MIAKPMINLHAVPDLQGLPSYVLQALKNISTPYRLKAGEILFHQQDFAHSFYIIQEGGIRLVEHTTDGQNVSLKLYGAGEIFGLLAISGSYPYPSSAETVQDSFIVGISGERARYLMKSYPEFAILVVDLLVSHVHNAHSRIRELSTERVERRLARALLQYCEKFGKAYDTEICIDIPLSQQAIAEFIGTTVETVNRLLKTWEDQGLVRRSRKHIDVLSEEGLIQIAEDEIVRI